jgi:hypothetical protein
MIYNPFRNDYINVNYAQTFDSELPYSNRILDHGKFFFTWENRSNVGFNYDFIFSRAGKNYDPEMGFELMEDYTRAYGLLGYGWVYNEEDKKILNQQLMLWAWINKRNEDFITDLSRVSIGYSLSTKSGYRVNFDLFQYHEYLAEPFDLSDEVIFPIGYYDYNTLEGGFGTPSNKLVRFSARYTLGTYYDGTIASIGPMEITLRPNSSFNFGLDYQYNQVNVPDRDQYFKAHLARFRTELTFTTKLSLMMFFQYNTNDKFGINNIRFRYNPREGNDLYIVYNGNYNTFLTREDPTLPLLERNTFLVKYTYTFIWDK